MSSTAPTAPASAAPPVADGAPSDVKLLHALKAATGSTFHSARALHEHVLESVRAAGHSGCELEYVARRFAELRASAGKPAASIISLHDALIQPQPEVQNSSQVEATYDAVRVCDAAVAEAARLSRMRDCRGQALTQLCGMMTVLEPVHASVRTAGPAAVGAMMDVYKLIAEGMAVFSDPAQQAGAVDMHAVLHDLKRAAADAAGGSGVGAR